METKHRINGDGSVTTYLTVEYQLNEKEMEQLQELLTAWQQWQNTESKEMNERPFADWKIEDVFQTVMEIGSKSTIQHHIKDNQFRFGMINVKQLCDSDFTREPYTEYTPEEGKE